MAGNGSVYTSFVENQIVGPQIDFDNDTIKVALLTNAYTFSSAHDFFDDVSAFETSGDGYTAGGETITNIIVDTSALFTTNVFGDATVWAADSGSPFTFQYAVIYKSTGVASTSPLIAIHDFGTDLTNAGTSVTLNWAQDAIVAYVTSSSVGELSDLTDVNTSTPTNRNVLVADGVDWESRALTEADISDLGTYLTDITGESVGNLSDVTLTGPIADNEVLAYDGIGAFINQTAAEAGLAAASHTHAAADVVSGTFANDRISQSSVTQHQAALSITEAQISDLGAYLENVSEDATPQLGGNLDVNGFDIVSATNGNIDIIPNGTGNVNLGNFAFDADQVVGIGTDNYILTYDNATGLISLEAAPATGLQNVVEDTSPQLGGNLDVNGNSIVSVSNGNITLAPDGTGVITASGEIRLEDGSEATPALSFTSQTGSGLYTDIFGNVNVAVGGTQYHSLSSIGYYNYRSDGRIRLNAGATGVGTDRYVQINIPNNLTANRFHKLPSNACSNGLVLVGDGTGTFGDQNSWRQLVKADISDGVGLENIVEDTSPQLGGSLDTNGWDIVGPGINIEASSGNVGLAATGVGGQVTIQSPTDGKITLSTASGGIDETVHMFSSVGGAGFNFDTSQFVDVTQDNYVLTYDNATQLISLEPTLSDLVNDTTPQLGGNLDTNNFTISNPLGSAVDIDDDLTVSGTINTFGQIGLIDGIGSNSFFLSRTAAGLNFLTSNTDGNQYVRLFNSATNKCLKLRLDGAETENASLKFDGAFGTPSAPEFGDMWADSNGLYFRDTTTTHNLKNAAFPIEAPDGTAAAPSYTFASNTDNGIYHIDDVSFPEVQVAIDGAPAVGFRATGVRIHDSQGTIFQNIGATQSGSDWTYIVRIPNNMTEIGQWKFPSNNNFGTTGDPDARVLKSGDGTGGSGDTVWGMITTTEIDSELATIGKVLTADGAGNATWETSPTGLLSVSDDTTPTLGGNLDVNGFDIRATSGDLLLTNQNTNGDVVLEVTGSLTGSTIHLRNSAVGGNGFNFNMDQVVGLSQDNYVLTYDNGTGLISLEAPATGGASQLSELSDVNTSTPTNRNVLVADGVDWESRALVEADISDLGTYLTDIVSDTTPQLGGNLDVQANQITTSTTNGSITIDPNGTGDVILGNYTFDGDQTVGAGQDNYVMTYDNATGKVSLEAAAGGGLANVVEDTTPQLGGNLDVQTFSINTSTVNGGITLTPNGTGNVVLGNYTLDGDQTVGAGQDNYVLTYDNATGLISLEAAAGGSSNNWLTANNGSDFASAPTSTGSNAIALGNAATTSTIADCIAIGTSATATGTTSQALGSQAVASGSRSIALGDQTDATGVASTAVGWRAQSTNTNTIAVGRDASASGSEAIAIGSTAVNNSAASIVIGTTSTSGVGAINTCVIGPYLNTQANDNIVWISPRNATDTGTRFAGGGNFTTIGAAIDSTNSTKDNTVTIGYDCSGGGGGSVTIGATAGTVNNFTDSVAIGYGAVQTRDGQVVIGYNAGVGETPVTSDVGIRIAYANQTSYIEQSVDGEMSLAGTDAQYVLPSYTVVTAPTGNTGGMAYFSDGDAGSPCVGVYDGTSWKRISLGATISTTS